MKKDLAMIVIAAFGLAFTLASSGMIQQQHERIMELTKQRDDLLVKHEGWTWAPPLPHPIPPKHLTEK